ncbi:TPA: ROK family protein [Streptococcus suis]
MKQYLSIDIGGTFIKYALLTESGEFSERDKKSTPATKEEFLKLLEGLIETYRPYISGVCIACPGSIQTKTGYVRSGGLIPYLKAIPLGSYLSECSGLPVTVLNDADAAGLAEAISGNLVQSYCGAALVLGTGVGLALVSEGQLTNLAQLQAKGLLTRPLSHFKEGEEGNILQNLGHILDLNWRGIRSLVANSGSAVRFITQASYRLGLETEDGPEVFARLSAGTDVELTNLFNQYCQEIAYLILNLRILFQLDKLVIGGGISNQSLLIDHINIAYQKVISNEGVPSTFLDSPLITSCHYHNDANIIGALYFHLQETA